MIPIRRPMALMAIATVALVGCSDTSDDAAPDEAPASSSAPAEAGAAASSSAPAEAGASAEVTIETFIFAPDPITVAPGTTITFENRDSTTHTVTAGTRDQPDPAVIDASLDQGDTVEWVIDEPGTYDYFCTIHSGPGMTGQVIVEG